MDLLFEHGSVSSGSKKRFGDKLLTLPSWYIFTPPQGRFWLRH